MEKLKNLKDLFYHQLRDIYNAEKQLIDALPRMKEEASSEKLKQAFEEHLEETKNHKARLEEIAETLGIELSGETCEGMKGLIRESKKIFSEDASAEVRDAGIIADAQRAEHYEISAYGTVVHFAEILNQNDVAAKLKKTLDEESAADQKLSEIAMSDINMKALNN